MDRARSISNQDITFYEVTDNMDITINAKILGSQNNEYSIMLYFDSATRCMYVIHDCPDFEQGRTAFCKHINKVLLVSDPALVKKLFTTKTNILCKSDISSIHQMKYQTELNRAKHLLQTKQYEEAISAMLQLFDRHKAINILQDALNETKRIEDPKYFLHVYQYLLFTELVAQIKSNPQLQTMVSKYFLENISRQDASSGIMWNELGAGSSSDPFSKIDENNFQMALVQELIEEVESSIKKTLENIEKTTKFDAICRIVSIWEILNMLPLRIRDSMLQMIQKQTKKLPPQSFILQLFSIMISSQAIQNPTEYILELLAEAFYSKVQPTAMTPYLRLAYFLRGDAEKISLKIRDYELFYMKYERDRYIQKLQFIKKLFYDYYDGKPFQYDIDFNHKGEYITIKPKASTIFDKYVFHKLGFDYSHPDYISTTDYNKNYPLLKELFDAPEFNSVYRFWGSEIPQISLIADFEKEHELKITTDANVKSKILIEWELLKNHLHGSFLSQTLDGQMIPQPDHPLTDKIRPFDIYLCEKTPTKIVDNVKYIRPIRKVHYAELPKILKYDIDIACSVAPLKELKEFMMIIQKTDLKDEKLFTKIDALKSLLKNLYLPKKQEILKIFVDITNQILSMEKEHLFKLLKLEDSDFCNEVVLAISGFNEFKSFFYDIDFQKLPITDFKVPLAMNIIMEYKKSDKIMEIEMSDEYKKSKISKKDVDMYLNAYSIGKELLSNYKSYNTYQELRKKAIEITAGRLDKIIATEGVHRIVNLRKLRKHPLFADYYQKIVKLRKEEFNTLLKEIAKAHKGTVQTKMILETYMGYSLMKSAFGDEEFPAQISSIQFDEMKSQIDSFI